MRSLECSFSSANPAELADQLREFCPAKLPSKYRLTPAETENTVVRAWPGSFAEAVPFHKVTVKWSGLSELHFISVDEDYIKFRQRPIEAIGTPRMVELAGLQPMQFMTCARVFRWKFEDGQQYRGPSFGDGHDFHGWFSAFRGKGHDRLASRRLLRYGPWRLIERPGDLSIIEYHDPNAEEFEALEQAKPGYQAMGLSPEGAFIHPSYRFDENTNWGTFNKSTGDLERVVVGRDVPVTELRELAAIRLNQPLNVEVKRTVLVFTDEAQARQHLHAAWLWGSVVRTFVSGAEVELTADFEPPAPMVLDWVKKRRDEDGF